MSRAKLDKDKERYHANSFAKIKPQTVKRIIEGQEVSEKIIEKYMIKLSDIPPDKRESMNENVKIHLGMKQKIKIAGEDEIPEEFEDLKFPLED